MTPFEMVREFHLAFGLPAPESAIELSVERQNLRFKLIQEEFKEYMTAPVGDLENVAKELADLIYVVLGTAVEHGLTRFDEIFAEVHRSNMSKLGEDGRPVHRNDGKVMKGPNFSPADVGRYIESQV